MIQGRELSDSTQQINALDGLRGFAVLFVFLGHASHLRLHLLPFADFSGIGKSGVYLFFVLSSFLLTSAFVNKGMAAFRKEFLLNYVVRRFFRIYPLYLLYLLLALGTSSMLWDSRGTRPIGIPIFLTLEDFFRHLLLTRNFSITWSIAVEFRYYFLLPAVAFIHSVVLKNRIIPAVALTLLLVVGSQWFWPEGAAVTNDNHLGPYLPIFLMGSLLALLVHGWRNSPHRGNPRARIAIECLGAAAALALVYMIPSVYAFFRGHAVMADKAYRQILLQGLLWSVVLFAAIAGVGPIRYFFESPFLRYLGFISFSMYLWHVTVLDYLLHYKAILPLPGWLALALTMAISHATWFLIEKPAARIRLRRGASRQQQQQTA